ncbi:subfamily C member [Brachionus plicatilis]|uniref:Subfamily C member n=1 Tax=Brachionus plicatilis TaxID=10195 RepID=A0A3M7QST7_BRAPC|nr:subfamily C member [Brachionus plicatilis]
MKKFKDKEKNSSKINIYVKTRFIDLEYEPVGKWFEQFNCIRHQCDVEVEEEVESAESSEDEQEMEESAEYLKYLQTLDPKMWRDQDHYKVIGLDHLRHKASQHQIKKAYKQKVLKHHPDKKKDTTDKDRDYFTCMTRAFETLSDPVKRVDHLFEENVPPVNENSKKNFYKVFRSVFEANARWSLNKNVPKLGDEKSTFEQVNNFYSFWYDFDSWREFSYLDEESKDSAADREERRWIDKQNKAARAKRKKEEMARIRQLVDNAYACDPRILKFKQEEKRKKEEEKERRKEAARLREAELLRKQEEARLAKEKLEEEERKKIEQQKKEKEQQRKMKQKERKTFRTLVKDFDYFCSDEAGDRVANMDKIENLIEVMTLSEIQNLNECIQKSGDKRSAAQQLIFEKIDKLEEKKSQQSQPSQPSVESKKVDKVESQAAKLAEWTDEEIKLLIKGSKLIAMGTRERWEVIANFIEEHSRGKYKRSGKECLAKTKEMQNPDNKFREDVNKKAYEKAIGAKKEEVSIREKPSERYVSAGEQFLAEQGSNLGVWTADEQKALEQALKTYPASLADRWDQIAACIPTRSKKDCIVRYKELVELIQAKKKAQQKVSQK